MTYMSNSISTVWFLYESMFKNAPWMVEETNFRNIRNSWYFLQLMHLTLRASSKCVSFYLALWHQVFSCSRSFIVARSCDKDNPKQTKLRFPDFSPPGCESSAGRVQGGQKREDTELHSRNLLRIRSKRDEAAPITVSWSSRLTSATGLLIRESGCSVCVCVCTNLRLKKAFCIFCSLACLVEQRRFDKKC